MSTPTNKNAARWASLWGARRGPEAEAAVQALREEHARRDAAALANRPPDGPTDGLGRSAPLQTDSEDADGNPITPVTYTLRVPGYGGVTVRHASDPTSALLGILELCEQHDRKWEPTLTRFGVLVAPLDAQPTVAFYVRRSRDGMTLAVPDARSRSAALLQIVQALLELQAKHRAIFEAAGVQPFRNG